jgi:DNA invertase Pin-like site-specific DNA recombinase
MRAAILTRFSSQLQTEASTEAQLKACRDWCKEQGHTIVDEYVDEEISGKSTDGREEFDRMIRDISKDKFDILVFHKFDRFFRNKYEATVTKKMLKDAGIKYVSVTEPIPDTPEGALLEGLLDSLAEFYSQNLAREVMKGMRTKGSKGLITVSSPPYGYKAGINGEHVIIPKESEIVQLIFDLYANGVPKSKIIEIANDKGYVSRRNNPLSERSLYGMLRNEKYIGTYTLEFSTGEKIVIKDCENVPPIISKDLWERVQNEHKNRVKPRSTPNQQYVLTGKLTCGYCGNPIIGGSVKRTKDGVNAYYNCRARRKNTHYSNEKCHNPSLRKDVYEKLVLDTLKDEILKEESLDKLAALVIEEYQKEVQKPKTPTSKLKKELDKNKKAQAKLVDLYVKESISNDILDTKMEVLKKEQTILEKEIKKNTQLEYSNQVSKDTVINFIKQFLEELPQDDYIRNRMLVNTFIDEILVFKDSLIITFKIRVGEMGDNVKLKGDNFSLTPVGDSVKLKSFDFILPPISFDVCINRISRNYIRK